MDLSVVMPAYNEEVAIGRAVAAVCLHVGTAVPAFELIVVDDGSRDRTADILSRLAAADPRIRVIRQANAGHGPAVIRGIETAAGEAVLLLDADDQIALDGFAAHWAGFQGADALIGVRRPRHDGAARAVISAGLRAAIACLFGRAPADPNVPYKLFRMRDWRTVAPAIGPSNPIPSALLAIHLLGGGRQVLQPPVVHRPRVGSVSTLRAWRLARFCLRAAGVLLAFRLASFRMDRAAAASRVRA